MKKSLAVISFLLILGGSASAQTAGPSEFRGYVSFDGGYQMRTEGFGVNRTFTEHQEDASFDAEHELKPGPQLYAAGGIGVWRNLHAGVAVSHFSRRTPVRVTGSIPHPLFFARNRTFEGETGGLKREELAVHVQMRAVLHATPRISLAVFGGPSWFQLKQGVVEGVEYIETYPYDTVAFSSANTRSLRQSTIGYNVGADAAFFFTRHLGVGGSVQLAGADMGLASEDGAPISVSAGGLHSGFGLRMRF